MKWVAHSKSHKEGFLLMEVLVSLGIELILFSSIVFFTVYPLQRYFSSLTERFIASEVVYKTRSASTHYGEDNNLNGIFHSQIVQGGLKIVTYDIRFRIEGPTSQNLLWSFGKIVGGRGGRIVNSEGKTIFNVVPVTGALTNP
ncbi:hypothetical protein X927_09255 [Petrotoga mexicana DSM 14811]|uniref:Uncharacterized protein n=1 Tax=Petrotoga mexicana DSM 14811 TaxID=1122954 RepID=A0A2K1P6K7_9BACT|nr:hypothetical protein [Petrotoga mexicana]PNR98428.1 hypothetical protein X927_09255 [Petrotoga mexicana DSM 14811]